MTVTLAFVRPRLLCHTSLGLKKTLLKIMQCSWRHLPYTMYLYSAMVADTPTDSVPLWPSSIGISEVQSEDRHCPRLWYHGELYWLKEWRSGSIWRVLLEHFEWWPPLLQPCVLSSCLCSPSPIDLVDLFLGFLFPGQGVSCVRKVCFFVLCPACKLALIPDGRRV